MQVPVDSTALVASLVAAAAIFVNKILVLRRFQLFLKNYIYVHVSILKVSVNFMSKFGGFLQNKYGSKLYL